MTMFYERFPYKEEVTGSNPVAFTSKLNFINNIRNSIDFIYLDEQSLDYDLLIHLYEYHSTTI